MMQGTTAIPGTITYSGTTAVFNPTAILDADKSLCSKDYRRNRRHGGHAIEGKTLSFTTNANTESTLNVVDLGGAGDQVILAKTGISSVPASVITGDIRVSLNNAASIYPR